MRDLEDEGKQHQTVQLQMNKKFTGLDLVSDSWGYSQLSCQVLDDIRCLIYFSES